MSETACPCCGAVNVWHIPDEGGHGRCRRCAVVLVWSFGNWRILTEMEWQRRPNLADIRPWSTAEARR